MGASGLSQSTPTLDLLKLCLVAGLAGCGNSSSAPTTGGSPINATGGGSGGSSSGGSESSSGSGSSGTGSSSGSSGVPTGSSGGAVSPSGADGGSTTMPMTFLVDGGADASVGGACKSADITPCSTFTTPTGTTIQLGPYGAQMDVNVGKGFENTVPSSDQGTQPSATCQDFANLFMENAGLTTELLTTTMNGITVDFSLYSVYRPAVWPSGPIPVLTWGNGTCAQPEGYGALLRYIASYGYFVVAANERQVGTNNTTGTGSAQPMLRALDYAAAANMDSTSPYYQKLDMTRVGAMGHSQGGAATVTAASDSRVKDIIIFNAADTGPKPYLAISGDMDITGFSAMGMSQAINAATVTVPAAYLYYHNPSGTSADALKGHLVLMLTPERVTGPSVAWWDMMFNNSATAKAQFTPAGTCGLCTDSTDYAYGANSYLK
jgi:hypothetical protein